MQTSFLSQVSQENNLSRELQLAAEPELVNLEKQVFNFWKGRHTFLFNGKLMTGPADSRCYSIIYSAVLFAVTCVFYEIILPSLDSSNKLQIGIGFGTCLFCLALFSGLTALTEPGVLPHSNLIPHKPLLQLETTDALKIYEIISGQESEVVLLPVEIEDKNASNKIILEDEKKKEILAKRFCEACKIYKPSKTYHCVKCNCCVRVFNHHCLLINNCIGKRNYKYFILMIFFGFLVDLYFVACLILSHQKLNGSTKYLNTFSFYVAVFQGIIVLGFCAFYLVNFMFTGGNRQTKQEIGVEILSSEKNEFWGKSNSIVDFGKLLTSEEQKDLEGCEAGKF